MFSCIYIHNSQFTILNSYPIIFYLLLFDPARKVISSEFLISFHRLCSERNAKTQNAICSPNHIEWNRLNREIWWMHIKMTWKTDYNMHKWTWKKNFSLIPHLDPIQSHTHNHQQPLTTLTLSHWVISISFLRNPFLWLQTRTGNKNIIDFSRINNKFIHLLRFRFVVHMFALKPNMDCIVYHQKQCWMSIIFPKYRDFVRFFFLSSAQEENILFSHTEGTTEPKNGTIHLSQVTI